MVLKMLYYNLDHSVFGLCPSSGIIKNTQRFEPEDENRSSFQNVVYFLEYQTMDEVQKLSSPDCLLSLIYKRTMYDL
jgi:hypothetical protein